MATGAAAAISTRAAGETEENPRARTRVHSEEAWARVADLPCEVSVLLPAPGLRVRDLLGIAPGFLVRTTAPVSADVPLQVNGQVIAWCEFEVVRDRLGVRLTELA